MLLKTTNLVLSANLSISYKDLNNIMKVSHAACHSSCAVNKVNVNVYFNHPALTKNKITYLTLSNRSCLRSTSLDSARVECNSISILPGKV